MAQEFGMAEFTERDIYLAKKMLAIAALTIERQGWPIPFGFDQRDTKALLDEIIANDTALAYHARAANVAVIGAPD
jgi:hypothetical protein